MAASRSSWLRFAYFLAVNALLAYATSSLEVKSWGALAGILLPLAFWMKKTGVLPPQEAHDLVAGGDATTPSLLWTLLLFAGVALSRLWDLQGLSAWPLPDEGATAFYAIDGFRSGSGNFFCTRAGIPFGSFALLSLLFKVVPPGLGSLWLWPALFSIATFAVGGWACRRFFPPTLAWTATALGAFQFWFLYAGRFCIPMFLFLWGEMMALACLAGVLRSPGAPARRWSAFFLGLCVGAGFFTWIAWFGVALLVVVAVFQSGTPRRPLDPILVLGFTVPALVGLSVLAVFYVRDHNDMGYVRGLFALQGWTDGAAEWKNGFTYVSALFWGTPYNQSYGPLWGGVLNPLSGALFLMGCLECRRLWALAWVRWVAGGLVLLLLPGFLSRNFEMFRILPTLPLLVLVATLGLFSLSSRMPRPWRRGGVVLILLASAFLDLYHLAGPYHRAWGTPGPGWEGLKSEAYWKAHQILGRESLTGGKGVLLADFLVDDSDQTLSLADYGLDPARHLGMTFEGKNWAAVVVDLHYQPFLRDRFPGGRWFALGSHYIAGSGIMLAVLPVTPGDRAVLERWLAADRALHAVTVKAFEWGSTPADLLATLKEVRPSVEGDPFLESVYWQQALYFEKLLGDPPSCLAAIREGLGKGYALPFFLNDEGVLWMREGRYNEARQAFERAVRSKVNFTPAAQNLDALEALMKRKPPVPGAGP